MFFPDRGIAALLHFFRKCCTIISPRGPKGAKKEKTIRKRSLTYVHIPTFPYNIGQNLIGYGIFRKHLSFTLTQTCENVELTVSKTCDPLFSLMTPFSFSMGPVDPGVENSGKRTLTGLISIYPMYHLSPG